MKKSLLLVLLIAFSTLYSQDYDQKIVTTMVWQAEAKSGGMFVGVSTDPYEASIAIDEVKFMMEGTKYQILNTEINEVTLLLDESTTVEKDFVSDDEYLEFKYISEIELIAMEYMEKNDSSRAVSFYTSVTIEKNESKASKHLSGLHSNYSKYIFERETPATLVSYSE